MIYGYDLNNECFYLLGDTTHGYGSHEVRFEDYINSISNRDDGMFNINIMEYNPEFSFDFSKDQLYKNLHNYVESLDSDVYHNLVSPQYGLDAIRQLKADILVDYGRGSLIRDKSFLVLCEHKKLMVLRLKYLNDYTEIQVSDLIHPAEEKPVSCASISIFSKGLILVQTGTCIELVKNSLSLTLGISP